MLVFISDLHLTDGSSGFTVASGAFEIFAERLQDLAEAASCRTDGSYRPIDRLDLVLLGDTLDMIRSSGWSVGKHVRPWHDCQQADFVDTVTQITSGILRHNDVSLAVLRRLANEGGIAVSPADGLGRRAVTSAKHPVTVKIHYMVGNHDWFLHLPGTSYDLLREALVRHMGLVNRHDIPFPHDATESPELLDVLRRHKVAARHGDIYDPFNFEGDRNASSLGDAIVVELLNRFALEVQTQLGDDLPESTLLGLHEIDNVRPSLLVPVWIDGLLERTCSIPELRTRVKLIWDRLADRFLELPMIRQRDTWNPNDLVDGLQRSLKFSRRLSIGWASKIVSWLHALRGQSSDSFYPHALAEQDFRNRRAKHIVYGHTHHAETVPLDASYAEGHVLNQVYFNCGTWRRLHRQTQLAPQEHEFVPCDVMTYIAFFQGDERKGRPYETWSGTLGIGPTEVPVHRIDAGGADHARSQSVSTPAIHGRGPHFAPALSKPAVVPTRRL